MTDVKNTPDVPKPMKISPKVADGASRLPPAARPAPRATPVAPQAPSAPPARSGR